MDAELQEIVMSRLYCEAVGGRSEAGVKIMLQDL
jgi:hypothetical protein